MHPNMHCEMQTHDMNVFCVVVSPVVVLGPKFGHRIAVMKEVLVSPLCCFWFSAKLLNS